MSFAGIFSKKPRTQRAERGDPSANLQTLAARVLVASCNEECAPGTTAEDVRGLAQALSTWPSVALDAVLPHSNPRLVLAARDAGLDDDEKHLRGVSRCHERDQRHEWSGEAVLRQAANARMLDYAIRREEAAYCLLRGPRLDGGYEPALTTSANAATFALVDIYGGEGFGAWLNTTEAPSLPRSQLLFAHERDAAVPPVGTPIFEPSLSDFEENFDMFSRGVLANLDWTGVVAAGGGVAACVLRSPAGSLRKDASSDDVVDAMRSKWFDPSQHDLFRAQAQMAGSENQAWRNDPKVVSPFATSSDIDLFLVGQPNAAAALATVQRIHRTMRRNFRGPVLACRTGSAVTFVAGGYPTRFVQVVLKLFPAVEDVLSAFDVDVCGFAYDGKGVRCTLRALRAASTRVNLIDLERRSRTYESRLLKYARRGFAIGCDPALLDRSRLDPTLFDGLTLLPYPKEARLDGRPVSPPNAYRSQGLARLVIAERFALTEKLNAHYLNSLATYPDALMTNPDPVPFMSLWANGWFEGLARDSRHRIDRWARQSQLPGDRAAATTVWGPYRGTRGVNYDEFFCLHEADDAEGAERSAVEQVRTTRLRPVLYSAGVLPWKLGWDCRRLEAILKQSVERGKAFDEYRRDPDGGMADGLPHVLYDLIGSRDDRPIDFTLTATRSGGMVPSEHVKHWGYNLDKSFLTEASFSLAASNASFFPVPPDGFNAHCHRGPAPGGQLYELVFKPLPHDEPEKQKLLTRYKYPTNANECKVGMIIEAYHNGKWRRAVIESVIRPPPAKAKTPPVAGRVPKPEAAIKFKMQLCGPFGTTLDPRPMIDPVLTARAIYVGEKLASTTKENAQSADTDAKGLKAELKKEYDELSDDAKAPFVAQEAKAKAEHAVQLEAAVAAREARVKEQAGGDFGEDTASTEPFDVDLVKWHGEHGRQSVRLISPLETIFRTLASADLLPPNEVALRNLHVDEVYNLKYLMSNELIKKRGFALRGGLTEVEADKVRALVAELVQDEVLSVMLDITKSLVLRPFAWPRPRAADDSQAADDDLEAAAEASAAAAATAAQVNVGGFLMGDLVFLRGLTKQLQFNGRKGVVLDASAAGAAESAGRLPVEVTLLAGEKQRMKLKPENLVHR